ncbi:endoplasmic reticulum protein [Aspergillus sclerotioniger CBS 115572]|uniref:Endoplasmic reticulum protein n=1 Tax=Aspergillus sclerotioniger CBS 115572 TaxID=1450535 RepID=A0A317XCI1_9EURO|nr:endoplasmic reticulum protein [Aspergillus sclerotioniger CBS 115572]PWY96316.1 endoplasmic reticulum protein [Aspergillus sclerotioniger CBS 115572]
MAPPPPSNLPLPDRLKALAQTLQFAWFAGHVTLLLSVLRYVLSYITFNYYSSSAQASYRLAFVSAAATYGIVVYKGHIARGRLQGSVPSIVLKLAGDENVQYLGMALVWLYSRQIPLALLPFSVYSVFHVATYTRAQLIPTIQGPAQGAAAPGSPTSPSAPKPAARSSPLGDTIGRFVKQYYDASMHLVAQLEMSLLFRLALAILTFSKGSFVLFVIYLAFFRARYAQSSFVQQAVRHFTARVDASVSHQSTPPAVRQGWESFKGFVGQAYEATDLNRLSAEAGAKKPQ